jgi:hypothetical protein
MIDAKQIQHPLFWDGKFQMPTSPKQIDLEVISAKRACELNAIWHSRLPRIVWSNVVRNRHYVCYGASYSGLWIACGIWSSPVNRNFDCDRVLELRRLAISNLCPKNTATNLISRMVKDIQRRLPAIDRLISYQDKEVHTGTIYKAANWQIAGYTRFVSWSDSRKRSSDQSTGDKIRWEFLLY